MDSMPAMSIQHAIWCDLGLIKLKKMWRRVQVMEDSLGDVRRKMAVPIGRVKPSQQLANHSMTPLVSGRSNTDQARHHPTDPSICN
jgi:hypothetical protein